MPTKPNNRSNFDWTFVNLALSAADEKSFLDWHKREGDSIIARMQEMSADGYKFSLSYDFDNECFIATYSGTRNTAHNDKCSISARSAEFLEAVSLVLFKHHVMCDGEDWQEHTRPANWG